MTPRRPLQYKQSEHAFAELFAYKDRELPFYGWGVSQSNTLLEEMLLGRLGPVARPQRQPGQRLMGAEDDPAAARGQDLPGHIPDLEEQRELGEDVLAPEANLDHETGFLEPLGLSREQAVNSCKPEVVQELEKRLEAGGDNLVRTRGLNRTRPCCSVS